ncbi:SPOR domain-containing protein [Paracoccus shandongensis]|uniref:SPOR domain-containing protein n=1 Tax=Paracoccus shandongensis TaxID=2816048 RepID=UPI001A8EED9A|nr:SPOR domain-containing protein [Paracoccus shandongensis]
MKSNRGWLMRVLGWMVLVLWLPGRVLAAPEPPPPGDYPGAQYIDRTGCVFVRDGADWKPRLDKQGAPICGFPPSQPAETAGAPADPPSPEEVLTAILAEGLRSGDLLANPAAPPLADAAPDPGQAQLDTTLAQQVDLDARLRSAMTGRAPDGLCARLGYRPAEGATPILGGDVTQGLCPGMTAPDLEPAITTASVQPKVAPVPAPAERPAKLSRKVAAPAAKSQGDAPAKPSRAVARRPEPVRPAVPAGVEMIPAHARYVQIGTYADEANAVSALRRLSGMGYRTAQRHERSGDKAVKAVLAGPFADRQALVAALTRLRANGYPRAVAR